MKKQTAEDVENIPILPINVLVLLISVERSNVYSVRNHEPFGSFKNDVIVLKREGSSNYDGG